MGYGFCLWGKYREPVDTLADMKHIYIEENNIQLSIF